MQHCNTEMGQSSCPSSITYTQPTITCLNLTIETLKQGVKYTQS